MEDGGFARQWSGVAILDADGSIVGWSEGAARLLGHEHHAAVGRSFEELILPGWARPSFASGLRAIWSGTDHRPLHRPWDLPIAHPNGTTRTLQAIAERISWEGRPDVVAVAFAEPRPRVRSDDIDGGVLGTLFERAPEIITVTAQDGRQLMVNSEGLRLLGYDDNLHRPPDGMAFIHPDDRAVVIERQRRIDAGDPRAVGDPVRFRVRSGTDEWRWLELVGADLTDVPEVRGRVGFSRDVTDAVQRSIALERTETRLQVLIERFGGPALLHDEDGTVINANDQIAAFFGTDTSGQAIVGTPALEVLTAVAGEQAHDGQEPTWRAALDGSQGTRLDVDVADGRSFEVTFVPIGDGDRVLGGFWMFDDVSERRRAARRSDEALALERDARTQAEVQSGLLQAADVARNEFLASISHELRTPLTSISSAAELLRDATIQEPQAQGYVEMIVRNTDRLRQMVEDLLLVSRLAEGMLELKVVEVPLLSVVADAVHTLEPFARTREVQVTVEGPTSATASIDARRIAQVVDNALANAIRHSPVGANVDVAVTADADRWELIVDDAGPGVPEEERRAVFQRFHQIPGGGPNGGAGLGLPIVRGIVELHGGRVHLEESPHGGARLICSMPRDPMSA